MGMQRVQVADLRETLPLPQVEDEGHGAGRVDGSVPALWALSVGAWGGVGWSLWQVLRFSDRGLFLADESFYLLAAQDSSRGSAFNGMFGWYLRLMLNGTGHDLARLRQGGLLLLFVAALVLAANLSGLLTTWAPSTMVRPVRVLVCAGVSGGCLSYYVLALRTPSYNWFASVGTLLVGAGVVRLVRGNPGGTATALTATLLAGGTFVAGAGKITTGLGLAGIVSVALCLVLVGDRSLWRLGVVTAGEFVLLIAFHLTIVADLPTTVQALQRAAAHLSVVDPDRYGVMAAVTYSARGSVAAFVHATTATCGICFLPILGWWRRQWAVPASVASLAAAGIWAAFLLRGGSAGFREAALPALSAVIACALLSGAWWRRTGLRAWLLAGCLLLLGSVYCLGSDQSVQGQLSGVVPLLLAAAMVLAFAVPKPGRALPVVLTVLSVSVATLTTLRSAPMAPFGLGEIRDQTIPVEVSPGSPPLLLDSPTARWVGQLRDRASEAGWQDGDRLIDLTFCSEAPLVLRAEVPNTLLPGLMGSDSKASSAAEAVRLDPADWTGAWLQVPVGASETSLAPLTEQLGTRFPDGYELIVRLPKGCAWWGTELWRPKAGRLSVPGAVGHGG